MFVMAVAVASKKITVMMLLPIATSEYPTWTKEYQCCNCNETAKIKEKLKLSNLKVHLTFFCPLFCVMFLLLTSFLIFTELIWGIFATKFWNLRPNWKMLIKLLASVTSQQLLSDQCYLVVGAPSFYGAFFSILSPFPLNISIISR